MQPPKEFHNRGALINPANRFEKISIERDEEISDEEYPVIKTEFFKDTSKSIISYNNSPDIFFETSLNPYRGCEHGCVYCYARPTHEYFGFSSGVDFESKIFVKTEGATLLKKELSHPKWKPQVLIMSGVTDCYQPFEKKFQITRQCLEVLLDFRNPVGIITKNRLVTRDIDIFKQMKEYDGVCVTVSVTSLDSKIARAMEPRASTPSNRLVAIETLAKAGVPVTVNVAPIIPGLTDHEVPAILKKCAELGVQGAGYTVLRLPYAVKDLFEKWLGEYFPDRKDKVLNRIRELRGGTLYNSEFGRRMKGDGVFAHQMADLFDLTCRKEKLNQKKIILSTKDFHNPYQKQRTLF